MPDPASKPAALQRTYMLTVKVHDLHGDSPVVDSPVSLRLRRADSQSSSPLFGPQGLLAGDVDQFTIAPVERDETMISEGVHQFRVIPNEYYFVPTIYSLVVGGRTYTFTMPAHDADVITLLDGDAAGGGTDPESALDEVGTALARLPEFSYDPITKLFTFRIPSGYVIDSMIDADTPEKKAAWRNRIGAADEGSTGGGGPLSDRSVTTEKLADGAVTRIKLADDSVDQSKIADDAVGPRELALDSVRTGHISDNAVESAKIPRDAILSRHIAADQITQGEMGANSVGTSELINGQVTEEKLSAAAQAKLNDRGDSGGPAVDQMARDVAAAAQATADAANTRANDNTREIRTARDDTVALTRVVNTKITRDDLPPFHRIELKPGGVSTRVIPTPFDLLFVQKITTKTISSLGVNFGGSTGRDVVLATSTPIANLNAGVGSTILTYGISSGGVDNVESNLDSLARAGTPATHINVALTFGFDDGTTYLYNIPFPVDDAAFA